MSSGIVFDPGRRKRLVEVFFELSEGLLCDSDIGVVDLIIPFSAKMAPLPSLILLSVVMTLWSSVGYCVALSRK